MLSAIDWAAVRLPANMNLSGSWPVDLAVWLFCFAYVVGMLAIVGYCAFQIKAGHAHRG